VNSIGSNLYDRHYGTGNAGNNLYGIIVVAVLLIMAVIIVAVGAREVLKDEQ